MWTVSSKGSDGEVQLGTKPTAQFTSVNMRCGIGVVGAIIREEEIGVEVKGVEEPVDAVDESNENVGV